MKYKSFKTALQEKPLLGMCSMYPSAGIIERIGQDWDWCWIDAQHGEWTIDNVINAVRACDLVGIFSLVRVPGHEAGIIGKVLDTGCHAIMVPMVETVQQAKAIVQAAKFPPLGKRSYGARRLIDLYGRTYSHNENPQPLLVCQIESVEGIQNVEAIAHVDGVDALFFGPDDMAQSKGMKMDTSRVSGYFGKEMKQIAEAATKTGKIAAGVFTTPDAITDGIAMGYRMMICCADVSLLAVGSLQAAKICRQTIN